MTTALVLSELIKADTYVSGSRLAKKAGVSRNAVWKAIERMRKDGYEIEAVPRRGYRIVSAPDSLRDYEVAAHLGTDELGSGLYCLDSIDSTNLFAKRIAREGLLTAPWLWRMSRPQAEGAWAGRGSRSRAPGCISPWS